MPRPARRAGERLFACLLVLLGTLALWQSYAISGFQKLSSPGVFPMLASAVMLVSALAILKEVSARAPAAAGQAAAILPVRLLIMLGLLVLYVVLMPRLGFMADSGLFLLVCLCWLWRRPWWVSLLVTLGCLAVVQLLFAELFQVVLPAGVFDHWLREVL